MWSLLRDVSCTVPHWRWRDHQRLVYICRCWAECTPVTDAQWVSTLLTCCWALQLLPWCQQLCQDKLKHQQALVKPSFQTAAITLGNRQHARYKFRSGGLQGCDKGDLELQAKEGLWDYERLFIVLGCKTEEFVIGEPGYSSSQCLQAGARTIQCIVNYFTSVSLPVHSLQM